MRLVVPIAQLKVVVEAASRAVAGQTPMPILTGILLEASGGTLAVEATDLEMAARREVAADIAEPGAAVVPGKQFRELVALLPGETVSLAAASAGCRVEWLGGRCTLPVMDAEMFPRMEEAAGKRFSFQIAELKRGLRQTAPFVAAGSTPYGTMQGVLFEEEGEDGGTFRLVATDGNRMAVATVAAAAAGETPEEENGGGPVNAPLSGRSLAALERILAGIRGEEAEAAFDPSRATFTGADFRFTTRILAGKYPLWRRVVPDFGPSFVAARGQELAAALERCQAVAADNGITRVRLSWTAGSQSMELFVEGNGSSLTDSVAVAAGGAGKIGACYDSRYLLKAIEAAGTDLVRLEFREGKDSPLLVRDAADDCKAGGYMHLIMPQILSS